MSNREMDRIFRERLENFEVEPPMHLWENIVHARANGRKPARPWLWWSGGAGVLAAGVAFWLLLGQTSWISKDIIPGSFPVDLLPTEKALASVEAPIEATVISREQKTAEKTTTSSSSLSSVLEAAETAAIPEMASQVETPAQLVQAFEGLTTPALKSIMWGPDPRYEFPERSCFSFTKEEWKLNWYLEAVGAPEYVFRSLTPRGKAFADYANAREKMEELRGGFSAGLRVNAVTDFGMSLRTGLQYSQINEVFNFRDPDDVRVIVTNVYDGNGNIIGSDTIYEAGTHIRSTYNRYRMIDLPVMAGYEFRFPRFTMTVHGGAMFNILFLKKGDILSPEGNPVSVSTAENDPYPAFRDRVGVSLGGSIGFNYHLTPSLQFVVEPQFRVLLDPVTRSDYPLSQEYFTTGISLGVRQKL